MRLVPVLPGIVLNDEHKLFTNVMFFVLSFSVALPQANIIVTRHVNDQ